MIQNENKNIQAPATSSLILEERHDSELFRVYAAILDGITDHILLPGKKLTESDLCRQMVCSRNTVRSALSLLAHDKIVDLQPNRGAFVHVPDLQEIRDILSTRMAMEEMIIGLLSELPDLEQRLQPIYTILDHEDTALAGGDQVGVNRISNAFHVELARLVGNNVLTEIMNTLCARTSLVIAVLDNKPARRAGTYNEHREILDLLVEGKRNRAGKMLRKHLNETLVRLEKKFETQ
ncbi:GntR family transcriptional regulator [Neisseria weaveri]|uniref:GntR family transcriptional regulator n=1 Tax=Neisseria weaveri TaxID=28091 RepID=A0A3S4ZMJ7_9NEIS|nr:transcriptional regulator, GntR family [Neisseria weaveri LMG 5135]SAY50345.1 GntR family transcriptional regulator [Neisseria weaveri]VEJ51753.1 GntR family transcriptional regulator [Neisseria weaveri]